MNVLKIQHKFNSQAKCLNYLEKMRWGKTITCPYCSSTNIGRAENKQGRHSCKICKRSFSVKVGTIFDHSRLPLPEWFTIIALMLNEKNGASAKEIQRNVDVTYKTIHYICMRVRIGMLMEEESTLHGIIEINKNHLGGSRKKGSIEAKETKRLTKLELLHTLKAYTNSRDMMSVSDEFKSYDELNDYIRKLIINWNRSNIDATEGFWNYVNNEIRNNFKVLSKKYLPFYLIEYEWKFNHRIFDGNEFEKYIKNALKIREDSRLMETPSIGQIKDKFIKNFNNDRKFIFQ